MTPMLHSKAVYTDLGDGKCTVFVGSHNWTGNGLNGANLEASVRVECEVDDPFAVMFGNISIGVPMHAFLST